MRWHVMHKLSIHFCVNLKKFCCPFRCHLISVHLPWNCHLAESSKIANLKTTPLLTKLYNIVKFPSIQLWMQTSLPSRPGLPILCIFLWSGITAPPCCRQLPDRWMCPRVFHSRIIQRTRGSHDHITWPGKWQQMLRCVNSRRDGYKLATNQARVWTLIFF